MDASLSSSRRCTTLGRDGIALLTQTEAWNPRLDDNGLPWERASCLIEVEAYPFRMRARPRDQD